jgi:Zn finger protein HypA/HybF involved in hydrogenase expression
MMNQGMRAMRLLFDHSTSVTCSECDQELKEETNLPKLARLGCPECGCTNFTFHGLPEDIEEKLSGIPAPAHD